jgi:hypothetical protein
MNPSFYWGKRLLAVFTCVGAGLALTASAVVAKPKAAPSADGNATTYSAQALAVNITSSRREGPYVYADTGPLSVAGGSLDASTANVNVGGGGLTIANADASAEGAGPEASAAASVSKFHIEVFMWTGNITIEADFIGANVSASCNRGGKTGLDAQVTIQNLTVNGQAIAVTGAANQEVVLPNDTRLIINERISASGRGSADFEVTALHFWACDFEGRIAQVHAGITVGDTPPEPEDHDCGKVTGGGWITGTPSGDKGNFGMSGSIRRGEFWGHLNYLDHGTGMHVQSTAVTGFAVDPADANGRIITYAVTIDGEAGTATLRVADHGEPGHDDIFDLTLSNGYHAAGDLGGARPGGGNVQLHKCPTGWE